MVGFIRIPSLVADPPAGPHAANTSNLYSQSVQAYLGANVMVGRGHHSGHDVVVVPAPEVFIFEDGAVVQPAVEVGGQRSVEHPAGVIAGRNV